MTIRHNHDWSLGNWEYFLQTLSLGHLQPRMGNTLFLCLWNETIAIFVASPFLSKSSILEKWYIKKNIYDYEEMQSWLDNGYLHSDYCLYPLNVFDEWSRSMNTGMIFWNPKPAYIFTILDWNHICSFYFLHCSIYVTCNPQFQ